MRRLLAALATAALLTGCGGGADHSTPTPAPVAAACRPDSMGATLRCQPKFSLLPPIGAEPGQTGIDLSNNDPSFGTWRTIRRHEAFAYFKVSEGTGFIDETAQQMAREARAAGLLVGGYDFQHVCGVNPFSEADVFILAAKHAGLLSGSGVLPPTADFEQGTGCNAKAWLGQWSRTVHRVTHDAVYSDPGFYDPSVGCFSEADYGWVADLGGFVPLCGLRTVFHQYSWTAWDGVARVDGDVFRGSYAQLQALARTKPPESAGHRRAREHRELRGHERVLRRLRLQLAHLRTKLNHYGCARRRREHQRLGRVCRGWFAAGDRVSEHGRHEDAVIAAFHRKGIR